jgi:hypothetical protein
LCTYTFLPLPPDAAGNLASLVNPTVNVTSETHPSVHASPFDARNKLNVKVEDDGKDSEDVLDDVDSLSEALLKEFFKDDELATEEATASVSSGFTSRAQEDFTEPHDQYNTSSAPLPTAGLSMTAKENPDDAASSLPVYVVAKGRQVGIFRGW